MEHDSELWEIVRCAVKGYEVSPKGNSLYAFCVTLDFPIEKNKLSSDKIESISGKIKQSSCFSFKRFQRKQSPAKNSSINITATDGWDARVFEFLREEFKRTVDKSDTLYFH